MNRSKRRLIPIVDRSFQFKYTAIIMGVAATISVVLGWFLLDAYKEMNAVIEVFGLSGDLKDEFDSSDVKSVFVLVVGFLGAEVIILGVMGLLITHKVCGPIYVFHRHLSTLQDGKYPTMRPLRKGDEFHATFEIMRDVVSTFKTRDQTDAVFLTALHKSASSKGLAEEELSQLQSMIDERTERTS